MVFDALLQDALFGTPTNVDRDAGALNRQLGGTQRFQVNQAIESRAGLKFNYAYAFGQDSEGKTQITPGTAVRWLPFYENPMITESRRANYASTDIFLRNEPIRLYTGSEPRTFKVDVHYSIYHMAAMCPTEELFKIFTGEGRVEATNELKRMRERLTGINQNDTGFYFNAGAYDAAQAIEQIHDRAADGSEGPYGPIPSKADSHFNAYLTYLASQSTSYQQIFTLLQYAVNNIRSSVIGSVGLKGAPIKGPPIVELKWGLMYNYVPCIVTDYRIQPIEEAGYDPKSLASQRLKVSLTLEEFHNVHGNLWGDPSLTGDLPGWDSVMQFGAMDINTPLTSVNATRGGLIKFNPYATNYGTIRQRQGAASRVSPVPPNIPEGP